MEDESGLQPRPDAPLGSFKSARRMLETLLAIAQTRLELVTTEIEEELHRVAEILLWMFVVVFFAGLTVLMLAFVIVIASNAPPPMNSPVFLTFLAVIAVVTTATLAILASKWMFGAAPDDPHSTTTGD